MRGFLNNHIDSEYMSILSVLESIRGAADNNPRPSMTHVAGLFASPARVLTAPAPVVAVESTIKKMSSVL
ncbi:MAG TPA: hypothetical protein VD770_04105 [Coxiellaceae bacterium]|nr:hypothetical protein [Coxiellaceae bacterium]